MADDKYTAAMGMFQKGLTDAAQLVSYNEAQNKDRLMKEAQAKYKALQEDRDTYLKTLSSALEKKDPRLTPFIQGVYNRWTRIEKTLDPEFQAPGLENATPEDIDLVRNVVVAHSSPIPRKEKQALISELFKNAKSNDVSVALENNLVQNILKDINLDAANGQGNYVRQLYEQGGKSYAVLGRVDESGNPVVVPVGADGSIPGVSGPTPVGDKQPFIKPQLPADQTEKSGSFASMENLIGRIRTAVVDPQTGGLSSKAQKWIGPVNSMVEKGKSYTPATDTDFTNFSQLVQDLENQITYLRSGKQINETEAVRLKEALPSKIKNNKNFIPNLDNFETTFKNIMAERQKAFSSSYRNIKAPQSPTNSKNNDPLGIR